MISYVSFANCTHFSLLTSLVSPRDLFLRAKELGQSAIAVADYGTLAGVWDALKASKETGVKLIIGCKFYFLDDATKSEDQKLRFINFYAKNHQGYKNLLALNKAGFENSLLITKRVVPIIDWKLIEKYKEGLICLTGCSNGIVGQLINNKKFEEAEIALKQLSNIFGDNLGVEVQSHNLTRNPINYLDRADQNFANRQLINLAKKHNLKVVPTTNSHYLKKEDADVHNVLLAIGAMQPVYSNARLKFNVSDLYVKSGDEVFEFFERSFGKQFTEEMCANSVYFADQCENPEWIDPKFTNPTGKELPVFSPETEEDYPIFLKWLENQSNYIKELSKDKSYLRFKCSLVFDKMVPLNKRKEYLERLDEELEVFEFRDFSSYMLIVADFVNWARKNNIRVGSGRGSVAGSLVAYFLRIHDADPIKYKLIFARFQNKEKAAMPDIDIDFAPSGRNRVQTYIRNKYDDANVAHVSNINTITPKVYVRDICRSCDLGGDRQKSVNLGNTIADVIPKKVGEKEIKTFEEAIEVSPLFAEYIKQYPELGKYALICGKYRAWSTHAAGLVISKRPLNEIVPVRKDKEGSIALEFDKDRAEENGLIKMDTLGLETLDIIDDTFNLIKKSGKILPTNFNLDDKETYDLLSKGDTLCVFQLGTSGGTIDLCRKVKPKSIEDISHINSLARPSARDIRDGFIKAKESNKVVKLLHPSLKRAFGETYGFGLYEESLMYLAQDVAGWSLHEADRLRKLTKEKGKNPKKALQWRSEFIDCAEKNNKIEREISSQIWDNVIEKFSGYGFNLSLYQSELIDIYTIDGIFIAKKAIKDIIPGEYVKSRDETTKKDIFVQVVNKHDHGLLPLVEVELTTGEKVKCTMNHKFRVKENGEMYPLWKIMKDGLSIVVNTASTQLG